MEKRKSIPIIPSDEGTLSQRLGGHAEDPTEDAADGGPKVVQSQDLEPGRVSVRVVFDPATHLHRYEVAEPVLDAKDEPVLRELVDALVRTLPGRPDLPAAEAAAYLRAEAAKLIDGWRDRITIEARDRILHRLVRDFIGFGPIDALMRDPELEDISCDGPGIPIYVFHRRFESLETNVVFKDDRALDAFVVRLAQRCGKQITLAQPLLDATLPEGSRLQASLSREVTTRGSAFTIRKRRLDPLSSTDLVVSGTMSAGMAAYFWLALEEGASILFAGGTASGKTSTLNAVGAFIPVQRKVVSIEDTREITLPHPNWVATVTRSTADLSSRESDIDMFKLLVSALRQRPEYVLVGEVRGPEANTLFQAMATGHATYSTLHADSAATAVYRLENPPINVPRSLVATLSAIAVQVQARQGGRNVRRIKEVVEITGVDPDTRDLITNTVFTWDPATDTHRYHGRSILLDRVQQRRGLTPEAVDQEFEARTAVIEWMVRRGVRTIPQVVETVSRFRSDRAGLLEKVRAEPEGPPRAD